MLCVKNSFIHCPHVTDAIPSRSRALSAPSIVTESVTCPPAALPQPVILPDHPLVSTPVIQFRSDIFHTVFVSPECERGRIAMPGSTTTLMVRNIPTRFTSVSFLRMLDECGFRGSFDFQYMPMDFRTGKNMGYCFINFVHAHFAAMFAALFHGRRLRMTTSTKVIEISPSKRQGLLENVELFKDSDLLGSLSLPHFKPLVLVGGALRPLSEKTFALVVSGTYV